MRYKVLLISFYNDEAYGLRQLHSILINKGYDAKILFVKKSTQYSFDGKADNRLTEIEEKLLMDFIINHKPDLIGISLVSSNFVLYRKLYNNIRSLGNFKIIIGGWHASLNPDETIKYCDALCIGEGEEALPELINNIIKKKPIDNIKNLWIKTEKNIVRNDLRPLISDLSQFPLPLFDYGNNYIENNQIFYHDPYNDNNRYGTIIGRGCPHKCTYCSNNFMATKVYPKQWSKIRYRTIEHVIKELREMKLRLPQIEYINFYDEVFLTSKDLVKSFCEQYKKYIGLPFYCMFYPQIYDDDSARQLKKAGLSGIWLGIQSGSERVRREIFKRYYTNDVIRQQVNIFHKLNISVKYDFIFDNPFETFEESLESIDFLLNAPEPFKVNLFSLKYFPNTEITTMAINKGIIKEKDLSDNSDNEWIDYLIVDNNKNQDSDFINNIAFYISVLASKSMVSKEKKYIKKMINNYISTKNIKPIKDIVDGLKK